MTRMQSFLAKTDINLSPRRRLRFGFQPCRAGVRTLGGAGMGFSKLPEPTAAMHSALCFSSWKGHMPPVGSSYPQQSSH